WRFPRADLARHYLGMLTDAPRRPLAVFGPRQTGKTYFLTHDLQEHAGSEGLRPVYVDLLGEADPLGAVNTVLASVLRELSTRRGQTAVTAVGALGVSVGMVPPQALTPSSDAGAWMATQFTELRRLEPKRPVLLMLDEAQTLARAGRGDAAMKAVRALFNAHPGGLLLLLTGSSKSQLLALIGDHSKTAFKLAAYLDFPLLGLNFAAFVSHRYKGATGREVAVADIEWAFTQLLHRPGELIDFVRYWITDAPGVGITEAFSAFRARANPEATQERLYSELKPLPQCLLLAIANDAKLFAKETRENLAAQLGMNGQLPGGSMSRALNALERQGILTKVDRGRYLFEDPQLREWLLKRKLAIPATPPQALLPDNQ
ncbi:MAG: hypothetical protein OEL91_05140, partial [Burkholderiaceae bacterium]|nr:hypothetical protein [Burkholderiaceae bacterium]